MSEHRRATLGAAFFAVCGVGIMFGVYLHPERVNGPVWLGYLAGGAFLLTGVAMLCKQCGFSRAFEWLILALLVVLCAVASWVAFGPGARACSVSLPFVSADATGFVCRGAFGVGAMLVGAMVLWQLVRILRGRSAA